MNYEEQNRLLEIYLGDCLEQLRSIPDCSVDSLVTDPPAGISFMGKEWDSAKGGRKEWCAWMESVMAECLRVLKPGGHGLVWAIPRTSHWTATALEDAGFEIRDCITHLFGSGFPKSLDVSKAIDKAAGAEREVISECGSDGVKRKARAMNSTGGERLAVQTITAPATDAAKKWQGWGTALKPAAEFWWLVRKPISEKTVAQNVQKWGTGALNIDGCRIGTFENTTPSGLQRYREWSDSHTGQARPEKPSTFKPAQGRFPANLVFSHSPHCTDEACDMWDCPVALLDKQSGQLSQCGGPKKTTHDKGMFGIGTPGVIYREDSRGASRFFYCAKISSSERNAGLDGFPEQIVGAMSGNAKINGGRTAGDGVTPVKPVLSKNSHPTVKPKKLMGYLIKLITPPGGTVLDPFMGSGSTGLAAKENGFGFIGIEKEKEYFDISLARLSPLGEVMGRRPSNQSGESLTVLLRAMGRLVRTNLSLFLQNSRPRSQYRAWPPKRRKPRPSRAGTTK